MLHLLLTALLFTESLKNIDCSPIQEPRRVVKDDWFTRALNYMKSNPETLEELMSKDQALLEGDMLLPTDRNAVESTWPTAEIPYVIRPELAGRTKDILSAMEMVSKHTCVSFHKRTSETNYLVFINGKGEFFSANGLPTIVSKSDMKDMGQRVKMTELDIERVRHLYTCGIFYF
ncbi:hypothetical protein L3Q82_002207 [Scortum barcoo]|uniref:Uncharacterized protein n=1 Tax=Scortum barcoo TaxID=214431 RepID=A0ACB8W203_9TELE|nr:hypothetical protein L3Q82_002207 [Scortum barcoo]